MASSPEQPESTAHEDPQTVHDARLPGAADPTHDDHDLAHDIHGGPGVDDEAHASPGHHAGDVHDVGGHGHGATDHDEHPVEDLRWVLIPLVVGLVIGVLVLVALGLGSGVG